MRPIESTSRIGFGAYRASNESREHKRALIHALRSGCTLVDTATTYMDGRSEALIGEVGAEFPDLDPCLVTKVGYAQGRDLAVLEALNAEGRALEGTVSLGEAARHSIHPDFLRRQVAASLARLRRDRVDVVLLHNPEHHLGEGSEEAREAFYAKIRGAFECLEALVHDGIVGSYGISSNALPLAADDAACIPLRELSRVAASIATAHHFKVVQFPFNIIERTAAVGRQGAPSLVEAARSQGLITCANRPINAKGPQGAIRLVAYPAILLDEADGHRAFQACVDCVATQLRRVESRDDPMDFTVMKFLRDGWQRMGDPDVVAQVFHGRLYPFLDRLYGGPPPEADALAFAALQRHAISHARQAIRGRVEALKAELEAQGTIGRGDPRPMPLISASHALDVGIDRVLVGMRRMEYVDEMKPLF